MANPQKEHGFTSIANELLEHACMTTLNGTQLRIILYLWRFTYGWKGQKETVMSLSQLAKGLDTTRSHVDRELNTLINRNIVIASSAEKGRSRMLGVNKNYDEWKGEKAVKEAPKEKPKAKRKKPTYSEGSMYYKMADYYMGLCKQVVKEVGLDHLIANSNLQTWADDFRKLIEIDKVDKKQVYHVMNWVVKDSFWRQQVLSGSKFRKQYLKLVLKMNEQAEPKQKGYSKTAPPDNRDREIAFNRFLADGGDPQDFHWEGDR